MASLMGKAMSIKEREEDLFDEWQLAIGTPFVRDGVVDSESYLKSPRKLLYVLKEANAFYGDLRCLVRDGGKPATWNNITRWTQCVHELPNTLDWSELKDVTPKLRVKALRSIAFMNIKKHAGGAQADQDDLRMVIERDQRFIRKQIQIYDADYVVCCGTCDLLKSIPPYRDLENCWRCTSRGIKYLRIPSAGWLIWFWHPQVRFNSNLLCYALADAVGFIERHCR